MLSNPYHTLAPPVLQHLRDRATDYYCPFCEELAQKHRLMTSASSMGVQMARSRMTPGCLATTSV